MSRLRWIVLICAGWAAGPIALATPPSAPPLPQGGFFYQFRGEVVLRNDAQTRWGRGAFRLEAVPDDMNDRVLVARAVDARRLPPTLSRWHGRRLRLHAWDGSSCMATITGFRLVGVARLVGPLATKWGALRDPRKGDPATGDEGWQEQSAMATAAWEQGAHLLVAEVDRQGTCAAGAWASTAELPAPALAVTQPVEPAVHQLAVDAFRALPAWQRLQQSYEQAPDRRGQPDPAWDRKDHAQPHVQLLHLSSGGIERRLVSVYAVHDNADAARDRRLWAVFELGGSAERPRLTLRDLTNGRDVPAGLDLHAVVDLDGAGRIGFLYSSKEGDGLMLEAGGALVDQPDRRVSR